MLSRFGNLDFFPSTRESFHIRTRSGGLISIFSLLFVGLLLIAEFHAYMEITVENDLVVDNNRDEPLDIHFNITFPRLPCAYFTIDALDVAGSAQLGVEAKITRQRLSSAGDPLSEAEKAELRSQVLEKVETVPVPQNGNNCGTCYGAEMPDMPCCETCEDVREAYSRKGWAFMSASNIAQCQNEGYTEQLAAQKGEGCRTAGIITVDKVGGNFHFSPGKSFTAGHQHIHEASSFNFDEKFDLSHHIDTLWFGDHYPGRENPLDGMEKVTFADNSLYQYYIKVVSTSYTDIRGNNITTNQYSVTQHFKPIDNQGHNHESHGFPGVYFLYDLSPIEVNLVERSQSFATFFTSVCALIGGIFTLFRVLDQFVYQSVRTLQKTQIGKDS